MSIGVEHVEASSAMTFTCYFSFLFNFLLSITDLTFSAFWDVIKFSEDKFSTGIVNIEWAIFHEISASLIKIYTFRRYIYSACNKKWISTLFYLGFFKKKKTQLAFSSVAFSPGLVSCQKKIF